MENILQENKSRFVLFPIEHHDIWDYYKKAQQVFWTAEEIDKLRATLSTRNVNLGRKVNRLVRSINSAMKENVSAESYYQDLKKLLVEPAEAPAITNTEFMFGYTDCFNQ